MKKSLRLFGGILFCLAIAALGWLLLPDLWMGFRPTPRHQEAGALTLIFVGASFIFVQLGAGGRLGGRLKGLLLGLAFVLWGGEHFIAPGTAVTAIDSAVIAIFVVDLGLVIAGHFEAPPRAGPSDTPG